MAAPTKLIGGFFLRLLLIYAGLMLCWPVVGAGYAAFFRGFGDTLFSRFGEYGRVDFQINPKQGGSDLDTRVRLTNRRNGASGGIFYPSRHGYAATALTLAFILSTPIGWRRRAVAAVWGLLLVHGFIALRLWIGLLDVFSGPTELATREYGPFARAAIDLTLRIFTVSPEATYVVPLFIWIVVCLRAHDFTTWRNMLAGESGRHNAESGD